MSGLAMPPAQPPADDVTAVLDRLNGARAHRVEAVRQEDMLEQALTEASDVPAVMVDYLRIERRVARNRTTLWTRQVRQLEAMARGMGLKP